MLFGGVQSVLTLLLGAIGRLSSVIGLYLDRLFTTLQPLYNTVRYNTVLDITRVKDGSQNCIDILINEHLWSFFNMIYTQKCMDFIEK